jgi:hypothetical protein
VATLPFWLSLKLWTAVCSLISPRTASTLLYLSPLRTALSSYILNANTRRVPILCAAKDGMDGASLPAVPAGLFSSAPDGACHQRPSTPLRAGSNDAGLWSGTGLSRCLEVDWSGKGRFPSRLKSLGLGQNDRVLSLWWEWHCKMVCI